MESKQHTRQVRDKVVGKFKAGLGYKKIALNITRSSAQSIILMERVWQNYQHGPPPKRTGPALTA